VRRAIVLNDPPDVQKVGVLPGLLARSQWSDYVGSPVVLTAPMLRKNREHHPEVDEHYEDIHDVLMAPTKVTPNKHDPRVIIFWRIIDGHRVLRAAVLMPDADSGLLPSILSFRLAQRKNGKSLVQG